MVNLNYLTKHNWKKLDKFSEIYIDKDWKRILNTKLEFKDIEKYETRVKELEEILLKPEHASDMGLINEYTNITAQLEKANEKWLELSEEKEQINID